MDSDDMLNRLAATEGEIHSWITQVTANGATSGAATARITKLFDGLREAASALRSSGEAGWIKGHPTEPGIYRVRGFHVGFPDDFAVVEVVRDNAELVCNIHCENSNRDLGDWSLVASCNAEFEWQRVDLHPSSQTVACHRFVIPKLGEFGIQAWRDGAPTPKGLEFAAEAGCEVQVAYLHPATPASAWRPIAEAPRDGGLFIGWVAAERWSAEDGGGSGRSADTSDVDFCQWLADSEHPEGGYFVNMMGQIGDMQDITHFQPLPTPPTSTKA